MTKRDQLGNFELMVMLVLIRLGENAYGVPICEELEKRTGRDVAVGSVYAALERLEDKGFVTSELGEPTPERGGRAKRYFHVSARGLKEVRETQRSLVKLWHGLPELEGVRHEINAATWIRTVASEEFWGQSQQRGCDW
jgi:DNA-binding PadR family transcriptional regulator